MQILVFSFLGNQVRGLDEDETEFLDYVSDKQREMEREKANEEEAVLNEYRVSDW